MKPSDIERAILILRDGGILVFPTETAYGMGCDATNAKAIDRLMRIKGRPSDQSLPVIVDSIEMAMQYARMTATEETLCKRHWPGPFTLILHDISPELQTDHALRNEVGMRVSSHPVAQALVEGLARPLVSTSANVSGQPTCYRVQDVKKQFAQNVEHPDDYLDVGALEERPVSMVVEIVNGEAVVHRGDARALE